MTSFWQRVPPVRWPSRDLNADNQKPQPVAEPAVAANVALKKEGESDAVSSYEHKSKSASGSFGVRLTPLEPRIDDITGRSEFIDPSETSATGSNPSEHLSSPLDRLNAALTDDAQNALPQHSVTMLEERLRVESLISHAREMLEIGQLERARDAALAAQEIGETAQIDYSPDEDRPLDLVRRIESQIESTRLTQESSSESDSSASATPSPELNSPALATKQNSPPEKDSKGSAKTPRNWSTLFRREKKSPPALPADQVTQTSNAATTMPAASPPKSSTNSPSHRPETHDAIVMANRSVSLGSPDPAEELDVSSRQAGDQFQSDSDSTHLHSEQPAESEVSEIETDRESPLVFTTEHTIPESDNKIISLPNSSSRELKRPLTSSDSSIDTDIWPDANDDTETSGRSNWTLIYVAVAIGIFSLLAVARYRRGAK